MRVAPMSTLMLNTRHRHEKYMNLLRTTRDGLLSSALSRIPVRDNYIRYVSGLA